MYVKRLTAELSTVADFPQCPGAVWKVLYPRVALRGSEVTEVPAEDVRLSVTGE